MPITRTFTPAGVTVEETPDPIPTQVSRFQARAALLGANLLDKADAAAKAAGGVALLAWQDAQVFERSSPTIAALGKAMGLKDSDIDALFVAAAGISA